MINSDLKIDIFGNQVICFGGIGKMFYQDGFPISMAVFEIRKQNVEVSILHVADECLKNGWTPETTLRKLKDDFADGLEVEIDLGKLERFCFASYEDQREIIFNYLFSSSAEAKDWLKERIL